MKERNLIRKFGALLLTAALVVSMTACGDKAGDGDNQPADGGDQPEASTGVYGEYIEGADDLSEADFEMGETLEADVNLGFTFAADFPLKSLYDKQDYSDFNALGTSWTETATSVVKGVLGTGLTIEPDYYDYAEEGGEGGYAYIMASDDNDPMGGLYFECGIETGEEGEIYHYITLMTENMSEITDEAVAAACDKMESILGIKASPVRLKKGLEIISEKAKETEEAYAVDSLINAENADFTEEVTLALVAGLDDEGNPTNYLYGQRMIVLN